MNKELKVIKAIVDKKVFYCFKTTLKRLKSSQQDVIKNAVERFIIDNLELYTETIKEDNDNKKEI